MLEHFQGKISSVFTHYRQLSGSASSASSSASSSLTNLTNFGLSNQVSNNAFKNRGNQMDQFLSIWKSRFTIFSLYRNVHNQSSLASSELWLGKISNVKLPHLHSGLPSAAYCSRPVGRSTCPVLQRISRPSQDITRLSNALQQIHSGIPSPFRSSVQVN